MVRICVMYIYHDIFHYTVSQLIHWLTGRYGTKYVKINIDGYVLKGEPLFFHTHFTLYAANINNFVRATKAGLGGCCAHVSCRKI